MDLHKRKLTPITSIPGVGRDDPLIEPLGTADIFMQLFLSQAPMYAATIFRLFTSSLYYWNYTRDLKAITFNAYAEDKMGKCLYLLWPPSPYNGQARKQISCLVVLYTV